MLSIKQMIQLALGFMSLANWVTRRIDRQEWKKLGYEEAMQDQLQELNVSLASAASSVQAAEKATPGERRKSLKDPT